jgi:hypothetical protein
MPSQNSIPADFVAIERPYKPAESRPRGTVRPIVGRTVPGRNERCPCGSGRKWKNCHMKAAVPDTSSLAANADLIRASFGGKVG